MRMSERRAGVFEIFLCDHLFGDDAVVAPEAVSLTTLWGPRGSEATGVAL